MTKFKVGDKVRILNGEKLVGNGNCNVTTGKEYEVISFHKKSEIETEHIKVAGNFSNPFTICDWEYKYIELVGTKPTKNQRITTLENEVAELKLIVHELRGKKSIEPSTTNAMEDIIEFEGQQYRKVNREAREGDVIVLTEEQANATTYVTPDKPYKVCSELNKIVFYVDCGDPYSVYTDDYNRTSENVVVYELFEEGLNPQISMVDETIEALTPNQQRAAIIEKAKAFVKENVANGRTVNRKKDKGNSTYRENYYDIDFFYKERKVTAVVYWLAFNEKRFNKPACVGRAKCSPNDVFNEHIGKAIALGRALGLDVSEFEQAVQPNEVVVGMEVTVNYHNETRIIEQLKSSGTVLFTNDRFDFVKNIESIINDTNAKYEVES